MALFLTLIAFSINSLGFRKFCTLNLASRNKRHSLEPKAEPCKAQTIIPTISSRLAIGGRSHVPDNAALKTTELYFTHRYFPQPTPNAALALRSFHEAASYRSFWPAPAPSPALPPRSEPARARRGFCWSWLLEVDARGL